jgi:8-hydroxy-5-deazaflavin:NADPH oxidoreductase
MKIAILGTGMVGETIASKLVELGHEVRMGSHTANNEKAAAWVKKAGAKASQGTFADAAAFGELLFNCTSGSGSIEALNAAGKENLQGKILLDISNPLDFSNGFPPTLFVKDTDSLGEQVQRAYPATKVVKTLNTLTASLMVEPKSLGESSTIFVSGDDAQAKATVVELLESFGHDDVIDLGPLETARGTEMLLPVWLRLMGALGTGAFNFKVVR